MSAIKKIVFLILPVTGLFFLLRAQIVRLALGAGVFDWDDTIRTASVLGIFLFSLLGQSVAALFARAFYAIQNTWTPLWIGIIAELTNIGCAFLLRGPLGIMGLAVAFSLATYVNVLLLVWQLRRHYGSLSGERVFVSCVISGIATVVLVLVGYVARQSIGTIFPLRTFWQVLLQAGCTTIAGGIGFCITAYVLRSPEFDDVIGVIRRKVGGAPLVIAGAEEAQGR